MTPSGRARLLAGLCLLAGPGVVRAAERQDRPTVVVTHALLGALVTELAGDQIDARALIPNGMDPHEWEPSPRDIEALRHADLVVVNGAGLEAGLERPLEQARRAGACVFSAADHLTLRRAERHGGGAEGASSTHHHGAFDPHLWTDPAAMKQVARALATEIRTALGRDLSDRLAALERRLDALDAEVRSLVASLPPERRALVTGHESLGYFADRYGFRLVGAVVPGLSTGAEASAAQLSSLKRLIQREHVKAVFTEVGTPPRVVEALSRECAVRAVPLDTHALPADGSYFTFLRRLAGTVVEALR